MTPAISVESVRKRYAGTDMSALDGVSFDIRRGEFFTLLGPSGCGKTTLLRMIAGFDTPDSGTIRLDGVSMAGVPANRRPINTVFQSYALFPHMTVVENIAFGPRMLGLGAARTRESVERMVTMLHLEGFERRRPAELSGGQQQRVALGRALAAAPKVLLLDEPLSALDSKLRKKMRAELKRLQLETGITFVFVTHDQDEALTMSDRIAVLRHGRVLQIGSPEAVYERPADRFVAEFIGEMNFLPATREAGATVDGLAFYRLSDGMRVAAVPGPETSTGEATLAIRPERVRLAEPGASGLQATVRERVYLGTDIVLHAETIAGIVLRIQLRETVAAPAPGEQIGLALPPEYLREVMA